MLRTCLGHALARACLRRGYDVLRLDNIDYVLAELFPAINLAKLYFEKLRISQKPIHIGLASNEMILEEMPTSLFRPRFVPQPLGKPYSIALCSS